MTSCRARAARAIERPTAASSSIIRTRARRLAGGAGALGGRGRGAASPVAGSATRNARAADPACSSTVISPPSDAHDLVADREAEPDADAERLRREERIEDAADHVRRDADAGVLDLDDRRGSPSRSRRAHADLVVVGAALGDRLRRVDEQVQEHLAEPRLVRASTGGSSGA